MRSIPIAQHLPDAAPKLDVAVRRLLSGEQVEEIVVYDVSDCQLYGTKYWQRLTGELGEQAKAIACWPEVYQSVYWLTLAYLPLKPLGTYLVIQREDCDDPDGDAEQFRAVRLPMDRWQVVVHYAIGLLGISGTMALLYWLIHRSPT